MGVSHRRRRAFALVTCVLWLLGVEVLPNLHLAHHHDDHTHDLDGTIVEHADHGHDHGTVRRDHRDHAPSDHDEVEEPEGAAHAAGGLAHRATALLDAPLPSHEPVELERAAWRVELPATSHLSSIALHRPTARGPPAT